MATVVYGYLKNLELLAIPGQKVKVHVSVVKRALKNGARGEDDNGG